MDSLKPGFHLIAWIASDARIADNCDFRSLRSLSLNGNYFKKSIGILATLAIEIETFLSLRSLRSLRQSRFKWKLFRRKDRKNRKERKSKF